MLAAEWLNQPVASDVVWSTSGFSFVPRNGMRCLRGAWAGVRHRASPELAALRRAFRDPARPTLGLQKHPPPIATSRYARTGTSTSRSNTIRHKLRICSSANELGHLICSSLDASRGCQSRKEVDRSLGDTFKMAPRSRSNGADTEADVSMSEAPDSRVVEEMVGCSDLRLQPMQS